MSHDENSDVLRLHSHRLLDDAGTPRMTHAMERAICQPRERPKRPGDLPAPLSLPDAWARLHTQEPPLAQAVAQTVIHKLTVRDAAPALGVCFKTVATRKGAGVAQIAVWTGLPTHEVVRQLPILAQLHSTVR